MTRAELRTLVWQWLDDVDGGYFIESIVNIWLNLATIEVQKRLLKAGENFYVKPIQTTTVANQADYVLPDDYVKLQRLELVLSGTGVNEDKRMLDPITLNQQRLMIGQTTGTPIAYSMKKNRVTLYPTPDQALTLRMYYSPRVGPMTSDSDKPDVPEEYHELVAALAAKNGYIKDDRMPSNLLEKLKELLEALDQTADERREDVPRRVVVTGDDDTFGTTW